MLVSPLRYPGGKAKLLTFVSSLLLENGLMGSDYSEAYAGGGGLALKLLSGGFVGRVHLNDADPAIYAFWNSVLNHNDDFCERLHRTEISVSEWYKQRDIYRSSSTQANLELGFAVYYLNRTSRSGIIDGSGPIGGYQQQGTWKLDARLDKSKQIYALRALGRYAPQISISCEDAFPFVAREISRTNTFMYLDPPYFVKGRKLYKNYYKPSDHKRIADLLISRNSDCWMLSYDDVPEIRNLYRKLSVPISYSLNYSAATPSLGQEVIYLSDDLSCVCPQGILLAA